MIKNFLNLKGHQNCITGWKVTAILLKGGFCLLVELHREGSAPAACAAGMFLLHFIFSHVSYFSHKSFFVAYHLFSHFIFCDISNYLSHIIFLSSFIFCHMSPNSLSPFSTVVTKIQTCTTQCRAISATFRLFCWVDQQSLWSLITATHLNF